MAVDSLIHAHGTHRLRRIRHGQCLYSVNDQLIGRSIDLYGEHLETQLTFLRPLIRPGNSVLEVGANIGLHTLFYAKQTGPSGMVFAIEPQRITHQFLCANIRLNALNNVLTFNHAAGAENEVAAIQPIDPETWHDSTAICLTPPEQGEPAIVRRVDSMGVQRIDFACIDVEGTECQALEGGDAIWRKQRPILYVDAHQREAAPATIERLMELKYQLYWHASPYFHHINFFDHRENAFGERIALFLLAFPAENAPSSIDLPKIDSTDSWPVEQ